MESTSVLHLTTRFLRGGSEQTIEQTLDALIDAEEEYDLHLGVGAEYNSDRLKEVENRGVETAIFQCIRHYNPITAIVAVFKVAFYLRHHSIDVIHTHSTEAGIIGRWGGQLARTPFIVHEIHGDPITDDRNTAINFFVYILERMTAPITDRLIAKSKHIRDTYVARGIGAFEQYNIIYHGIDLEQFQNIEPTYPNSLEADYILLFVGRLVEGKGLFDLLHALDQISVKGNIVLLIAGDGPLKEEIEIDISERGASNQVQVLGYRSDIPSLMQASDALILPSYREGTPRVITEALASGLPVVATKIAGIPEQVNDGETGLLIPPGDTEALSTSIEILLADDNRRKRMGKRAKKGLNKYSHEQAQSSFQRLYADIANSDE